ncbi:MAG TPA: DNA primase [Myxococcota bacterium]|nr:DNA primase [Myxococcota bacterium]
MGRIPEETLQAIRDRTDLVELVGRHVALKKAGRSYKGLCPFHHEKTPSFQVNPDRGIFHCFGCGESGNAFAFLIRIEGLSFPEAVRTLAASAGVTIPESGRSEEAGLLERVLEANAAAQKLYRHTLASEAGRDARAYLEKRGLPADAIETFGVGYAPPAWDALVGELRRLRIPAEIGARAGLLRERDSGGHYDLLRGRVTFPIQDARGRVVAFGGRAMAADQEPKYLNSPESPVFRKREAFYGLPHALESIRRGDRIVVVEGYFDRIALHRAGVEESLATCGTALSEDHARALRRRARQVVLLFDGDGAGHRAALRALELLLPAGLRVRAAALPAGDDPDTFLLREGGDALRALVDAAPPALDLAIADAVAPGVVQPEQKADALARVVPLVAKIVEPAERTAWAQRLALAVGARELDVEASVRAVARGAQAADVVTVAGPTHAGRDEHHLAQLVQVLLEHPAAAAELDAALLADAVTEPVARELVIALHETCGVVPGAASMLPALEARLGPEALAKLHALAAEDAPECDPETARRVIRDIGARFDKRRRQERQRALTESLHGSAPGESTRILREKIGIDAR